MMKFKMPGKPPAIKFATILALAFSLIFNSAGAVPSVPAKDRGIRQPNGDSESNRVFPASFV
jgi:hypothetical protein